MIDGRHCTRLHFYFAGILMRTVFAESDSRQRKDSLHYYIIITLKNLVFIFLSIYSHF